MASTSIAGRLVCTRRSALQAGVHLVVGRWREIRIEASDGTESIGRLEAHEPVDLTWFGGPSQRSDRHSEDHCGRALRPSDSARGAGSGTGGDAVVDHERGAACEIEAIVARRAPFSS